MTTLLSSCVDCLETLGASTSWSPKGLSTNAMGELYLYCMTFCSIFIGGSRVTLDLMWTTNRQKNEVSVHVYKEHPHVAHHENTFHFIQGNTSTTNRWSDDRALDAGGSVTRCITSRTLSGSTWTTKQQTNEERAEIHCYMEGHWKSTHGYIFQMECFVVTVLTTLQSKNTLPFSATWKRHT